MNAAHPPQRLVSLDAFRGLAIASMILVNNPGDWGNVYPPLLHAEWHGWTPTDLIFPSFLFIVGVSLVFSLSRRSAAADRTALHLQILRRTVLIFLFGLFLNLFPSFDLSQLRIAGVLQRIAIVYGITATLVLHTSIRAQAWITGAILLIYWGLLTLVPVPGHGAGVLTPEGNLAAWLDQLLLPGRMWEGTWDPEGILSTLPSIATALCGVLTGHWLRSGRPREVIAGRMFVAGWLALLAGMAWGLWFPINKNLWTSSFVVFTSGASLQCLAFCYWLIDIEGSRRWAYPAVVYGMNAITVYVASGVITDLLHLIQWGAPAVPLWTWLYQSLFAGWLEPRNASLAFAVLYVVIWFGLMDILYRKKIFLKV
jgi:predicted acyltransferase